MGLTSCGYRCAVSGKPGVYAEASTNVKWIQDTICTFDRYEPVVLPVPHSHASAHQGTHGQRVGGRNCLRPRHHVQLLYEQGHILIQQGLHGVRRRALLDEQDPVRCRVDLRQVLQWVQLEARPALHVVRLAVRCSRVHCHVEARSNGALSLGETFRISLKHSDQQRYPSFNTID